MIIDFPKFTGSTSWYKEQTNRMRAVLVELGVLKPEISAESLWKRFNEMYEAKTRRVITGNFKLSKQEVISLIDDPEKVILIHGELYKQCYNNKYPHRLFLDEENNLRLSFISVDEITTWP